MNPQICRRDGTPLQHILIFGSFNEEEAAVLQSTTLPICTSYPQSAPLPTVPHFPGSMLSDTQHLIPNNIGAVRTLLHHSEVGSDAALCLDRNLNLGQAPSQESPPFVPPHSGDQQHPASLQKAQSQAQAQAQAQLQTQLQAQAQLQAHLQAQSQAQIHAPADAQAQAQAQAEAQAQAQRQAQAGVQAQGRVNAEARVQAQVLAQVQTQVQAQVQVQVRQQHASWGVAEEAVKDKVVTEVGLVSGSFFFQPQNGEQLAALAPPDAAGGGDLLHRNAVNQHLPPLVDKLPLDVPKGHIKDSPQRQITDAFQGHISDALEGHYSDALQRHVSGAPQGHTSGAPQGHTSDAHQGHTPDSSFIANLSPVVDKLPLPCAGASPQVAETTHSIAVGGQATAIGTGGSTIGQHAASFALTSCPITDAASFAGREASPVVARDAPSSVVAAAGQGTAKAAPVSWAALVSSRTAQPTPAHRTAAVDAREGPTTTAVTPAVDARKGPTATVATAVRPAPSAVGPTAVALGVPAAAAGITPAGVESLTTATNAFSAQIAGSPTSTASTLGAALPSTQRDSSTETENGLQHQGHNGLSTRTPPPSPASQPPPPVPTPPPVATPPPPVSVPTTPPSVPAPVPAPPSVPTAVPTPSVRAALGPRGFLNGGNLCFANSTLQALIGCTPFVSLLNELQQAHAIEMESSPTVSCFLEFWKQLHRSKLPTSSSAHVAAGRAQGVPGPVKPAPKPQGPEGVRLNGSTTGTPASRQGNGSTSGTPASRQGNGSSTGTPANRQGNGKAGGVPDAPPSYAALAKGRPLTYLAPPLDPSATFERVLSTFSPQHHRNGLQIRQEDAQEFLSFLLERMHEELAEADNQSAESKGGVAGTSGTPPVDGRPHPGGVGPVGNGASNEDSIGGEDGWETVGPKNKASITRQHTDKESKISSIFSGQLYSMIKTRGAKDSVTVQPFSVLQLDIARDAVRSVEDALLCFTEPEHLEGYRPQDGKGSYSVPASKVVKIKTIPQVLILHLMRFTYNARGSVKLHKPVAFPLHLTLTKDLIYAPATTGAKKAHTYKLFATVVHHGKEPSRGHYTADVRQQDDTWLRFDDANVLPIHASSVAKEQAYLLLYELT